MAESNRERRRRVCLSAFFAVAILVPSLWGFGSKFIEFVHLYQGDVEGAFAIAPIVNYLLASAGFLFALVWAAANGMFRDIEAPKHQMLEREAELDRKLGYTKESPTS